MELETLLPARVGVGLFLVLALAPSVLKRGDLNGIRSNARKRGWEILFLERAYSGRFEPARYHLRYRDQNGAVNEAVLERDGFSPIQITRSSQLPKHVELAMTDFSLEMDCRNCGTTIPKISDRCRYCGSKRDLFNMPNQIPEPKPDGAAH